MNILVKEREALETELSSVFETAAQMSVVQSSKEDVCDRVLLKLQSTRRKDNPSEVDERVRPMFNSIAGP